MQDDEKKLLKQIHNYETHITKYRQKLNLEGVVLFVTSVSILGVTEYPFMQLFAIALVAVFLIHTIYAYLEETGETRTFPKIYEAILKQIGKNDNYAHYKLELVQFEKMNVLMIFSPKSDGFIFMLSVLFYALTLISVLKLFE